MHSEWHSIEKIGWLRAAVLGANDGIVSTASLLLGVASANASPHTVLLSGIAGLAAGAMSMAAGEYVSVSSQADAEKAALAQEQAELEENFQAEHLELAMIYVHRGLDLALAKQVAEQLMNHDALGAHALDELGISAIATARPLQAACVSALSFSAGAILPLFVAFITKSEWAIVAIFLSALLSLAGLGGIAAKMGGAPVVPSATRITFWSVLAMGVSSAVGALFGATFT